ncbi:MAG: vitamin K epoxide reductase family protein [Candidatus Moranbacteria bacterium]|nr:vitamin K epoxide reductase family protein [Candidatus Moranbacteria bacterium]
MKKYRAIAILSAVALVNAIYLSYKAYYFRYVDPLGLTSFCDFSKVNSCSEVLRHPLSNVFGIPFPWVALAVYPVLLGLAWYGYKHQSYLQAKILVVLSFLGVCFNGFIIYREIFFIKAFCLLCFICTLIIVTIFVLSLKLVRESKDAPVESQV